MSFFSRLKPAAKILLRGDPKKKTRNPIPAITAEEVADARMFFPREKFFIFGHARSGTTRMPNLRSCVISAVFQRAALLKPTT